VFVPSNITAQLSVGLHRLHVGFGNACVIPAMSVGDGRFCTPFRGGPRIAARSTAVDSMPRTKG
jgi:hypothetical protein